MYWLSDNGGSWSARILLGACGLSMLIFGYFWLSILIMLIGVWKFPVFGELLIWAIIIDASYSGGYGGAYLSWPYALTTIACLVLVTTAFIKNRIR